MLPLLQELACRVGASSLTAHADALSLSDCSFGECIINQCNTMNQSRKGSHNNTATPDTQQTCAYTVLYMAWQACVHGTW
jgi:hypothetical protein